MVTCSQVMVAKKASPQIGKEETKISAIKLPQEESWRYLRGKPVLERSLRTTFVALGTFSASSNISLLPSPIYSEVKVTMQQPKA